MVAGIVPGCRAEPHGSGPRLGGPRWAIVTLDDSVLGDTLGAGALHALLRSASPGVRFGASAHARDGARSVAPRADSPGPAGDAKARARAGGDRVVRPRHAHRRRRGVERDERRA